MQEKIEYRIVDLFGFFVCDIPSGQPPYKIQKRTIAASEWTATPNSEWVATPDGPSEPEPEDIDYGRVTFPPTLSVEYEPYADALDLIIARANLWARMNNVPEGELVALDEAVETIRNGIIRGRVVR